MELKLCKNSTDGWTAEKRTTPEYSPASHHGCGFSLRATEELKIK